MKTVSKLLIVVLLIFLNENANATATEEGDWVAGKAKAMACNACHGADGIGTIPIYPNLAGQKGVYLVSQLKAFRDGTRQNPIMNAMVTTLSDTDIADLAAFYQNL